MNLLYSPSYLQMATKGRADIKVEQMYWGTRHESKVGLVERVRVRASDVEILEEAGGLGGENIGIDKGYKDKRHGAKKGCCSKRKVLEMKMMAKSYLEGPVLKRGI